MTTQLESLAQRYSEAWATHDPDAIVALHTEDTVFQLHAGQEAAVGREAVREAFAGILALLPDIAYEMVSLHFGADHWAVEWRVTGTTPEGRRVEFDLADVVVVRDGLVASKQSYADSVVLQAQLGEAVEAAA